MPIPVMRAGNTAVDESANSLSLWNLNSDNFVDFQSTWLFSLVIAFGSRFKVPQEQSLLTL